MTIIEAVARAIAVETCPVAYDYLFENKTEWVKERGERNGQFLDCNVPYKVDLRCAAKASILATLKAIEEPSEEMCAAGAKYYDDSWREGHAKADTSMKWIWQEMLSALTKQLEEQSK